VYFARKFEPIINQEIINNIDMLFGRDLTGILYMTITFVIFSGYPVCRKRAYNLCYVFIIWDVK